MEIECVRCSTHVRLVRTSDPAQQWLRCPQCGHTYSDSDLQRLNY